MATAMSEGRIAKQTEDARKQMLGALRGGELELTEKIKNAVKDRKNTVSENEAKIKDLFVSREERNMEVDKSFARINILQQLSNYTSSRKWDDLNDTIFNETEKLAVMMAKAEYDYNVTLAKAKSEMLQQVAKTDAKREESDKARIASEGTLYATFVRATVEFEQKIGDIDKQISKLESELNTMEDKASNTMLRFKEERLQKEQELLEELDRLDKRKTEEVATEITALSDKTKTLFNLLDAKETETKKSLDALRLLHESDIRRLEIDKHILELENISGRLGAVEETVAAIPRLGVGTIILTMGECQDGYQEMLGGVANSQTLMDMLGKENVPNMTDRFFKLSNTVGVYEDSKVSMKNVKIYGSVLDRWGGSPSARAYFAVNALIEGLGESTKLAANQLVGDDETVPKNMTVRACIKY